MISSTLRFARNALRWAETILFVLAVFLFHAFMGSPGTESDIVETVMALTFFFGVLFAIVLLLRTLCDHRMARMRSDGSG